MVDDRDVVAFVAELEHSYYLFIEVVDLSCLMFGLFKQICLLRQNVLAPSSFVTGRLGLHDHRRRVFIVSRGTELPQLFEIQFQPVENEIVLAAVPPQSIFATLPEDIVVRHLQVMEFPGIVQHLENFLRHFSIERVLRDTHFELLYLLNTLFSVNVHGLPGNPPLPQKHQHKSQGFDVVPLTEFQGVMRIDAHIPIRANMQTGLLGFSGLLGGELFGQSEINQVYCTRFNCLLANSQVIRLEIPMYISQFMEYFEAIQDLQPHHQYGLHREVFARYHTNNILQVSPQQFHDYKMVRSFYSTLVVSHEPRRIAGACQSLVDGLFALDQFGVVLFAELECEFSVIVFGDVDRAEGARLHLGGDLVLAGEQDFVWMGMSILLRNCQNWEKVVHSSACLVVCIREFRFCNKEGVSNFLVQELFDGMFLNFKYKQSQSSLFIHHLSDNNIQEESMQSGKMESRTSLQQILISIRNKILGEEAAALQEVLAYEKILNKELSTDRKHKQRQIHEERKEKQQSLKISKAEQQRQEQLDKLLEVADLKLKQEIQVKQKPQPTPPPLPPPANKQQLGAKTPQQSMNYHYRQAPPLPNQRTDGFPRIPTTDQPKRPNIKQEQRMSAEKKTQKILKERQESHSKKDVVTGKVTETVPMSRNIAKSQSVQKVLVPPTSATKQNAQSNTNNKVNSNKPATGHASSHQETESSANKESSKTQGGLSSSISCPVLPNLQSFRHDKSTLVELFTKQAGSSAKIPPVKPYIDSYSKEEMGYRHDENKYRLKFLHSLTRYAAQKRKIAFDCTDTIPQRGWPGSDYAPVFKNSLNQFSNNMPEHESLLTNKRVKATTIYRTWHKIQKIKAGFQSLVQEKRSIVAPDLLRIEISLPNGCAKSRKRSAESQITNEKGAQIDKDEYLVPFYRALKPKLQSFLKIENALKKNQLKSLNELLGIVLTDNRRFLTVVAKTQVQRYQNSIALN